MSEAHTQAASKLIREYEAVRSHQQELMTNLLDVLPNIDNVDPVAIAQVRDAMFHADNPFLLVLTGPFSSGKSSIINALLGDENLLRIGPVPTTDRIAIIRWGEDAQDMQSAGSADTIFYPSEMLKRVSFVDTPGLQSVFQEHEETTRKFLHRADVVLLVMLATQAMTQANLKYLQMFREYGKKIILVINQADLLSDEERETVREYVAQQAASRIGSEPLVWMISAKQGMAAWREDGTRDEAAWQASGLHEIEGYIAQQLNDTDRMRQKLQTPLKIVQNVHRTALESLRDNQQRFDQYRSITQNLEAQLKTQKQAQEHAVRDTLYEVEQRFTATADRAGEALRDIFQFARAFSSLGRGLRELLPFTRFFRRKDKPSYIKVTFDKYRVFEPIDELAEVYDKLGPRIEGNDMQDIDDLVKHCQRELRTLPPDMQAKVIGTVQAPVKYDRTALQDVMPRLADVEKEAHEIEVENLEQVRRNTLLYLAVWELIVLILLVVLMNTWDSFSAEPLVPIVLLVVLLSTGLLGFASIPLRGRMIHTSFTNRLLKLQSRYSEELTRAADKQIAYGMELRRDTIAPLTRLVEAQSSLQDEQMNHLQQAEQSISKIEAELNALGKRNFLGIRM